ncbi:hypothetical protein ACHHYP_05453 [Achlya hypogyna]|uniref:Uncharacterized protein n=1 Tax=Achlya hypogyna TaxID=1202772 RepID=A0A1V9YXR8_ACHHY|nr:hypothetical protein ACHHYP_05453 [Achlya hypogyna]
MGFGSDENATVTMTVGQLNDYLARYVQAYPWFVHASRAQAQASRLPPVDFHTFEHLSTDVVSRNMPQNNEIQYGMAVPAAFSQVITADDIKAPWLASCDIEDIKQTAVRERFPQFGGQVAVQCRVIRYCIEPVILVAIARHRWKQTRPVEEISDLEVYAYLKTDCEQATAAITAFQARVHRELRCDESIKDSASRVLCLTAMYEKICDESGFPRYYDAEVEAARNHIIAAQRPAEVQSRVRSEVSFSKRRFKLWDDIVSLCIERMDAWCTFEPARVARLTDPKLQGLPTAGGSSTNKGKSRDKHGDGGRNRGEKKRGDKQVAEASPKPLALSAATGDAGGTSQKPKHACLKCKAEDHNVWLCPQIPDSDAGVAEKKALLRNYYDARKQRQQNMPTNRAVLAVPNTAPPAGSLASVVRVPISVQLDSGADMTVVTRAFINKALTVGCELVELSQALASATLLAHPDPLQAICNFPDASMDFYGGIVTQVPRDQLDRPVRSRKLHQVHVAQLKLFYNASKTLSAEQLDAIDYSTMVTEVDHFQGYRINDAGIIKMDTVWLGIEGSSWEPVSVMAEDVYLEYKQYMQVVDTKTKPGTMAHKELTAILREFPIDASSQYTAKVARKGRTQRMRIK